MSILRKAGIVLVVLCTVAMILPSTAAAIEEPDNWGDPVFNYTSNPQADADPPGDLEAAFLNYDSDGEAVQFRINFTDDAPDYPLSNNLTQVYIDSESGGVDNSTYQDSSFAEEFYNNTDDISADLRLTLGDQSDVLQEWDSVNTEFNTVQDANIEIKERTDSVVVEVEESDIAPEEDVIDLKFVYLDADNNVVEDDSDYTWAPDANDEEINSTRFSLAEDGGATVPTATVEAVVNVTDTAVADGAGVDFEVSGNDDGAETNTDTLEGDGSNNITKTFIVDSRNFDSGGSITAELTGGGNYELNAQEDIGSLSEDDVTKVVFQPHELIDVDGEVQNLPNDEDSFTVRLENSDGETVGIPEEVTGFDGTTADYGPITANATEFSSEAGSVVVELDAGSDSETLSTSRFNPEDKTKNFDVQGIGQTIRLETNVSKFDVQTGNGFNITAYVDSSEIINNSKHTITYSSADLSIKTTDISNEVDSSNNYTEFNTDTDGEITVYSNTLSGDPLAVDGSSTELYNITFRYIGDNPEEGEEVPLAPTISEADTTLINSTGTERDSLEFSTSEESVDVTNSETLITDFNVEHVTASDMVGAETVFEVTADTNGGQLDKIELKKGASNTVIKTVDLNNAPGFDGTITTEIQPGDDTYVGPGYSVTNGTFNISVVDADGDFKNETEPRGTKPIYLKGDVTVNDGGVGLGDLQTVIDNRGETPGDENGELARSDVNNDGAIDITDISIVADEYDP